jgi:hypothetical protein
VVEKYVSYLSTGVDIFLLRSYHKILVEYFLLNLVFSRYGRHGRTIKSSAFKYMHVHILGFLVNFLCSR